MIEGKTPNAARKKAREHAAALLDAEDAERRRREAERRRRVTDNAAEIAGNDAEIAQLSTRIEELRRDSGSRLAAIVADGVGEAQAAAMTGRETREVKAAVKASAAGQTLNNQTPTGKKTAPAHSAGAATASA